MFLSRYADNFFIDLHFFYLVAIQKTSHIASSPLASLGASWKSLSTVLLAPRVYLDDEKLRFPDFDITLVRPEPITP
jgi:hypothetical protein